MTKQRSIAEARNSLPGLVREAESGTAIELTRRGESVAVLIGRRQYERLSSRYRRFAEAYDEFRRTIDLTELAVDPDAVFAGLRDDAGGRRVPL